MSDFLGLFTHEHGSRLLSVAIFISLLSSYACIGLVRHGRAAEGGARLFWCLVAALAVGFGIWSTHFIAMLGFSPGFAVEYRFDTTLLSLSFAIAICGLGLSVAVISRRRSDLILGGAIVGVGIASMHFIGVKAMLVGGAIEWNLGAAGLATLLGILLGAAAVLTGSEGGWRRQVAGAMVLAIAICVTHFTGMAAADFSGCFAVVHDNEAISPTLLSAAIGIVSIFLLMIVLVSISLDQRVRLRKALQLAKERADRAKFDELSRRLTTAWEHVGQALCLFDKTGHVVVHNGRLPQLLGLSDLDLSGKTLPEINLLSAQAAGIGDIGLARIRAQSVFDEKVALIRPQDGGETEHIFPDGKILRAVNKPVGDGTWVMTIEDITERRQTDAKLLHLAHHDLLTGLPNRSQFVETLRIAIGQVGKSGRKLAVVTFDIDHLSDVNDAHGPAAGDAAILGVADRVRASAHIGETIARVGGDEFSVVKLMDSAAELEEFIPRLLRGINAAMTFGDHAIVLTACTGIAIFPDDAADCDRLIANANLALSRARAIHSGTVCLYDPAYDEVSRQRRRLMNDMQLGLEHDQFFVAYQVQKSVLTGAVTGYEALLRWRHPTRGMVPPDEFIPIAEQSGLILPMGKWVLEKACREAKAAALYGRLAVNLSPLQLGDETLVDAVADILAATGMPATALELEVTETAIISGKTAVLTTLQKLQDMGIAIALDDFGTGYSSLETLRSFPWDKIKLDRSFIAEIETSVQAKAIMNSVIALGKALDTPILVEGVETAEQLSILQKKGCDLAQGYFLGRPAAIEALKTSRLKDGDSLCAA